MSTRQLPAVGLGCAALGLAAVPEASAQATLEAALEGGIAYFDTSPLYGAGLSEKRLGRALAATGTKPFISTKVGYHTDFPEGGRQSPDERVLDFSAAHLRRSLTASLERLGVDRIDLALLHDVPDVGTARDAAAHLADLRTEGLVGAIGIGVTDAALAAKIVAAIELDAVLIAGRYTLLNRSAEAELFPLASGRQVAIIAGGIFNSGILADPDAGRFDYKPASDHVLAHAARLAKAAALHGTSLKAAALHFVAANPQVSTTLLGAASPSELAECLALLAEPLPGSVLRDIASA